MGELNCQRGEPADLFTTNDEAFRSSHEVVSYWQDCGRIDPRSFEYYSGGRWWEILDALNIVLLVSREYEHLLMGFRVDQDSRPDVSYIRIPHPSGLAINPSGPIVHVASTRNPNQIFDFQVITSLEHRTDIDLVDLSDRPLIPVRTRILPGSFYLHEIAFLNEQLYANSVGQNAIIRIDDFGQSVRVWWPKCIELETGPVFECNHIQLNSIAADRDLATSYYTASTDEISEVRPGNPEFQVDRRGVIFSGETREPIVRGLTRPHTARLWRDRLWINNSGYGEIGYVDGEAFQPIKKMPGWTRGLCFRGDYAFVGTSKILPRFPNYAPGLQTEESVCGIHILNLSSGEIEGYLIWPNGNQIFSLEMVDRSVTTGWPFRIENRSNQTDRKHLFTLLGHPR